MFVHSIFEVVRPPENHSGSAPESEYYRFQKLFSPFLSQKIKLIRMPPIERVNAVRNRGMYNGFAKTF